MKNQFNKFIALSLDEWWLLLQALILSPIVDAELLLDPSRLQREPVGNRYPWPQLDAPRVALTGFGPAKECPGEPALGCRPRIPGACRRCGRQGG